MMRLRKMTTRPGLRGQYQEEEATAWHYSSCTVGYLYEGVGASGEEVVLVEAVGYEGKELLERETKLRMIPNGGNYS